ncbi:MAG: glycoside hydrolase family 3 protein, partial [Chitinophagaceae bacterium]|nr:glycoside hydrolase family 3 protein [Chitinophagaceae bacterium]
MKYFLAAFLFFFSINISIAQPVFLKQTPTAQHWVDSVFKTLSKDEKIAQLMVMRESEMRSGKAFFYEEKLSDEIKKYNIGSICLFQGSPVEQAQVINRLQRLAKTPLMVCIDAEMGLGMRMTDSVARFPDQITLGAIRNKKLMYEMGVAMGEQCKRMGIQVNYAPDVDINNNPNNPVIGYRSFGEDKNIVSKYGTQIMKGMQSMGVMACAKHFPGHGDVAVDSHLDLPVINKSRAQLDELELVPFKKLIDEGVGSVMVAHLSVPSIDTTTNQPTSLSAKTINGLLRQELDFQGITFTDGLEMKGVTKFYPEGDAAAQSLIAGNDMLCLPGDIEGSIKKIKAAIKHKKLSWTDIDNRVKKVLLAKYNLGLSERPVIDENNLTNDLNKDVRRIRTQAANEAITVLQMQNAELFPLEKNKKIAYVGVGADTLNTLAGLLKIKLNADCYYISYKNDSSVTNLILGKIKNRY